MNSPAISPKHAAKIEAATLADAQEWNASNEKIIWCVEFLEAFSVDHVDAAIDALESKFETLLQ